MAEKEELTRKKRCRNGHRTSAKRIMASIGETLMSVAEKSQLTPHIAKLKQQKSTLEAKLKSLREQDEAILALVSVEDIELEIEQGDISREKIESVIIEVQMALDEYEKSSTTQLNTENNVITPVTPTQPTTSITGNNSETASNHEPVTSPHNLKGLRTLYDTVESHIRAFKSLGVQAETYGNLLCSMLLNKLPQELCIIVSREVQGDVWELGHLLELIEKELEARERATANTNRETWPHYQTNKFSKPQPSISTLQTGGTSPTCTYCQQSHTSNSCTNVSNITARIDIIKRSGRCFLCLRKNYLSRDCNSKSRCHKCNGKHHISICTKNSSHNHAQKTPSDTELKQQQHEQTSESKTSSDKPSRSNQSGNSGTKSLANLKPNPQVDEPPNDCVNEDETYSKITLGTSNESSNEEHKRPEKEQLQGVHHRHAPTSLSNNSMNKPLRAKSQATNPVDQINQGIVAQNHCLQKCLCSINTNLGWVLSGPVENHSQQRLEASVNMSSTHVLQLETPPSQPMHHEDDQQLRRFWDLESLGISKEEKSVVEEFTSTIGFKAGRYHVELPWKEHHPLLPDNYEMSRKRLWSLLERLKRDPEVLKEYDAVIKDQLTKGVVEIVQKEDIGELGKVHYIPHHAVIRRDKETTKLRIVYDASAKTSEKASLMIAVSEADRNVLRFLWFDDVWSDQPKIIVLRFTRVVFGVSSSPFLLNATISHHIEQYRAQDPAFVEAFMRAVYVDDLNSEGGFNLRKTNLEPNPQVDEPPNDC
ncbi:Hypothetical predicted protein, partial [Paramuricea clavata]